MSITDENKLKVNALYILERVRKEKTQFFGIESFS